MPIYEYRCRSCNVVSEAFVRSGKEPTACPECGAEELSRLISKAGIIFKGSGFYINDSKVSNSEAPTSSSDSKEKKSADSAPAKSDTGSSSKTEASTSKSSSKES